jgi:hypothetical protein
MTYKHKNWFKEGNKTVAEAIRYTQDTIERLKKEGCTNICRDYKKSEKDSLCEHCSCNKTIH